MLQAASWHLGGVMLISKCINGGCQSGGVGFRRQNVCVKLIVYIEIGVSNFRTREETCIAVQDRR